MPIKIPTIRNAEAQRRYAADLLIELGNRLGTTEDDAQLALAEVINNKTIIILNEFKTIDPQMIEVKQLCKKLAVRSDPVLITGPSGTGKEILARALHGQKDPSDFYAINCAGMPDTLIESELFGYAPGAFTSANKEGSIGILRAAAHGTVFLDEIGEAPMNLQAKLLRALQPDIHGRYHIRPVGSKTHYEISTRIIAATKKDLFEEVKLGNFREDLYGRLMTYELHTTPLSQRTEDIQLILGHLGITNYDLSETYWVERLALFNVRALQAYAKRAKLNGQG